MVILEGLMNAVIIILIFVMAFIMPSFPIISMIFPSSGLARKILMSIVLGTSLGVAAGLILIPLHVVSSVSFILLFILLYGILYILMWKKGYRLYEIPEAYRGLIRALKEIDIWTSTAISAFIAGMILRFHQSLTVGTLASSDPWGHYYMAKNLMEKAVFFANDFYGAYPRGSHIVYVEISTISNIDLLTTIKFVGPMFGTLTMLALYVLASEFLNRKVAALATVLYIIPVLGMLPPPFPVWYGYLFPRQELAVTENIGLIFLVAQIVLVSLLSENYRPDVAVFYTGVAIAFAYIHPLSVLYAFTFTAIILVLNMRHHTLHENMKYAMLSLISPMVVYVYFYTIRVFYGISPTRAQESANIVTETSEKVLSLPYYNINPYYTTIIILSAIMASYFLLNRKNRGASLMLFIVLLGTMASMGISLFTSPSRSVYNLNFYTPVLYATVIYGGIEANRVVSYIKGLSTGTGKIIDALESVIPDLDLIPTAILGMMAAYATLYYLNFNSSSPVYGSISYIWIFLLSFIAVPIIMSAISRMEKLFYMTILLDTLIILMLFLFTTEYNVLWVLIMSLTIIANVYLHISMDPGIRRKLIMVEVLALAAFILYLLPSSSSVRKMFPLLILATSLLYSEKRSGIYTAIFLYGVYVFFRIYIPPLRVPWYYISVPILILSLAVIFILDERRHILLLSSVSIIVPLGFSMYYTQMFAFLTPIIFILLIYAFRSMNSRVEWYHLYALATAVYLLAEIVIIYPPVWNFMALMSLGHFIKRISWILPEIIAAGIVIWRYTIKHTDVSLHTGRAHFKHSACEVSMNLRVLAIALVFVIALPPYVTLREIQPYHFEEWAHNVEAIAREYPANETVVYCRIEPGWFMASAFPSGMEVHSLDELLSISPMYYTTTKKYTLICVDKYNYSRYARMPERYFHSDYWLTPEVYRWLDEYREFHGNSSLVLVIDGKYTSVYMIKTPGVYGGAMV